jgi:hypothetical protein
VVAGTAGAVRHHQNQKYARQDYEQQQMYAAQQQQYAPPPQQYAPEPAAAPAGDDLTAQLQQLAQLYNAGVLSDEEFAAAKQKLLSG